jgi:hypothetical protein
MKKINLIIIAVLFFLLISCAGSAKKKGEEAKKTNETAKQTTELAKKTEEVSADKKDAAEDSAAAGKEESPNAQTAQAETDAQKLADEKFSLETDSATKEVAAVTPPAQAQPQTPPVQTPPQQPPAQTQPQQPELTPPPVQTQPQTPPAQAQQQTPPAQPPAEEKKSDTSDSASSDTDQTKKYPSPSVAGASSAPAPRIESVLQMGTMPNDKEIVFSRIVRATVGQIVEIPFRGNGWVYLGEIASQRGVAYNARRNDSDGQTFIFTLEEPGTYVLKFYRQDFIRDYILNDHVQVVVGDAPTAGTGWFNPPADRGKVVAQPRWPSPIEETQIRSGTKPVSEPVVTTGTTEPAKTSTPAPNAATPANAAPQQRPAAETAAPQRTTPAQSANTQDKTSAPSTNITSPVPPSSAASIAQIPPINAIESGESESVPAEKKEILSPEAVMQKAKENFDGGNIPAAIALLDQFMADYPGGSDEVYWLLGQYYEANSPSRNILLSLDYYRRLVNEYPQSSRFNDARRRIAYLERYYINIQ